MCLALADGRIQRDDDECVWRVALGQYKDAHYGIILHPVILRLQTSRHALAVLSECISKLGLLYVKACIVLLDKYAKDMQIALFYLKMALHEGTMLFNLKEVSWNQHTKQHSTVLQCWAVWLD